jgi:putative DNA-invertase from lambdoid prophage Rac
VAEGRARAAIWARVSTSEQEVSNQVAELYELAARRGWTVVEIYAATASAWRGDHRRELDRVISDARGGKFDVLLVWALDRLSREGPLETLQIVDRLARAGVQVVSLQEPWTEATGELRDLMLALVGWVARFESRRRSERTRAGMERARAEGKRIGRPRRPPVEAHRRWPETRDLVLAGVLTSAEGARRLRVRRVDFAAAIKAARGVQKGEAAEDGSSEFGPTA